VKVIALALLVIASIPFSAEAAIDTMRIEDNVSIGPNMLYRVRDRLEKRVCYVMMPGGNFQCFDEQNF